MFGKLRREKEIYHKTFYCNELSSLSDGVQLLDMFLLSDIQYCSNERGIKWLNVTLSDKTGSMNAKIWADKIQMEYESFQGQIVIVSGTITFYAGKQELIVDKMLLAKEAEYELSEIIKILSDEKIRTYKEQIHTMIENISSESIQAFVSEVFTSENIEQMTKLPVRLCGHHAYQGALLEHISEVVTGAYCFVRSTAVVRELKVDLDLVIAGALLHDAACLLKYEPEGYLYRMKDGIGFCNDGYLMFQIMENAKKVCELDAKIYQLLLHIIEASHGNTEPKTMEAMVVSSQNKLSAELETYESECLAIENQNNDGCLWSQELKRELYRIRR